MSEQKRLSTRALLGIILTLTFLALVGFGGVLFWVMHKARHRLWEFHVLGETCTALASQGTAVRRIDDGGQCAVVGHDLGGPGFGGSYVRIEVEASGRWQTIVVQERQVVSMRAL